MTLDGVGMRKHGDGILLGSLKVPHMEFSSNVELGSVGRATKRNETKRASVNIVLN